MVDIHFTSTLKPSPYIHCNIYSRKTYKVLVAFFLLLPTCCSTSWNPLQTSWIYLNTTVTYFQISALHMSWFNLLVLMFFKLTLNLIISSSLFLIFGYLKSHTISKLWCLLDQASPSCYLLKNANNLFNSSMQTSCCCWTPSIPQ